MVRDGSPVTAAESEFFGLNLGEYLDESKLPALVEATREARVWNVPTQVLMENLVPDVTVEALQRRPEMRYVAPSHSSPSGPRRRTRCSRTLGASAESARRTMSVRRKLIKALHAGKAGLLLGSDAPQIYNVPGFSIHRELQSLVAAGLTPYQALETGTRNVAVFFGTLATTGTIGVGQAGRPGSARRQSPHRCGQHDPPLGGHAAGQVAAESGDREAAGGDSQVGGELISLTVQNRPNQLLVRRVALQVGEQVVHRVDRVSFPRFAGAGLWTR